MGNKAIKAAASKAPAAGGGVPKAETQGATSSPESSPSVPAYDPGKSIPPVTAKARAIDPEMLLGECTKPADTTTETAANAPTHDGQKAEVCETPQTTSETVPNVLEETKQETTEEPPVITDASQRDEEIKQKETMEEAPSKMPEGVPETEESIETEDVDTTAVTPETDKEASKGVAKDFVMPPLELEKVQNAQDQPAPVEEVDPNLMSPPPFLTDEFSSLKDTEKPGSMTTDSRTIESHGSESVLLATPITHDEVSLVEPTPINEPVDQPKHRDDISIDEEVSAISEDHSAMHQKGPPSEDVGFSSVGDHTSLGHVPEDAVSLTSSVARGEDELLKNIMGVSVTLPALTSNESVRGSVAVSEMTFDESQWECMRRADSSDKAPLPLLVTITLDVLADGFVTLCFCYEEEVKPSTAEVEDTSAAVANVVDSIFEKVGQQSNAPEATEDTHGHTAHQPVVESEAEDKTVKLEPVPAVVSPQDVPEAVAQTLAEPKAEEPKVHACTDKPTESPISVELTEVEGDLKVTLGPGEETPTAFPSKLQPVQSGVSDKQFSVELDSPFVNVSESTELTDAPPETAPPETESKEKSPASEETKKLSTSKSKKKKTKSGEVRHSASPGLKTSTSDGTASVDSTGSGTTPKPKPQTGRGRSTRGRGHGRGHGRGNVAGR